MQLFAQCAQRRQPGFALLEEATNVVRVCQLVEGAPLAIELAAAATRDFSCDAIAEEIAHNLNFLATTMRDMPERHRSMRAVFDRSWNLLTEDERRVFGRVSVFRGGFEIQAAEQIVDASNTLLATLMNKSLLRRNSAERYEIHELLRQYAAVKLQAAAEEDGIRTRHLNYFVTLAERAESELGGAKQGVWLNQLAAEHDNMRAALQWALDGDQVEAGLRLAGGLYRFWNIRGYMGEGRRWLEQLIAKGGRAAPSWRAKALHSAGSLACVQRDYEPARAFLEEGLALKRTLGDKQSMALSLNNLGSVAVLQGQHQQAHLFFEESLDIKRELGDKRGIAFALSNLAVISTDQGNYEQAEAQLEESLALRRELKDNHGIAASLTNLGSMAYARGDYVRAQALHEASLSLCRELGDTEYVVNVLSNLGVVLKVLGDLKHARSYLEEGLTISRELRDKERLAYALNCLGDVTHAEGDARRAEALYKESIALYRESESKRWSDLPLGGLARLADESGQSKKAVRLFGAAEGLRQALGMRLQPPARAIYERWVADARAQLDAETFEQAWREGKALSLEQAIADALEPS